MKITLIVPPTAIKKGGNFHTAVRWKNLLYGLGHQVRIEHEWQYSKTDMMIALHARRSHDSIRHFAQLHSDLPLIVALTGTDLYRDIRTESIASESLRLAHRLIILQDMGLRELPKEMHHKTRIIYQSVRPFSPAQPLKRWFQVCVIGHLRAEKDPFCCAKALHYLPGDSRIRLLHVGHASSHDYAKKADKWMQCEKRYTWVGPFPHWKTRKTLQQSKLMVISSIMEGGANVVSEAMAAGVPVLASCVPGNIGMLGTDYSGYFPPRNARLLAKLLCQAETDATFYNRLSNQCANRSYLVNQEREKQALRDLLSEFAR